MVNSNKMIDWAKKERENTITWLNVQYFSFSRQGGIMHNRNWPTYHPLFVIVTLLASVTIAASSGRQRQLTGDPSNLRSNQLALINYDDSDTSADTSALSSQVY